MIVKDQFKVLRTEQVSEVNGVATLLEYLGTGTKLLTVQNDDNNKVFGASFLTLPENSTGAPHIIEHSVLCGSSRYRVKDPFLYLLQGSCNTYLNAFTSSDHTCYPVASTNHQDFLNLMRVYLDAVFRPRLREEAFLQEAWRYELKEGGAGLRLNGVVFNEMKGAYSEPMSLMYREISRALLPTTPYAYDHGGDPREIPNLTYEDFCRFHKENYHPSRAFLYLYGNFDESLMFEVLADHLAGFERATSAELPPLQPRYVEPVRLEASYPFDRADADEGPYLFVTLNWLLGERRDAVETMALSVLDHLLLMMPSSPLKRALIESELGEGIAAWGLDDSIRESTFSTGLRGVRSQDSDLVVRLILDTLQSLVEDGIDPADIEAAFNEVEFDLRENNTGGTPQGLAAMSGVLKDWLYGGDPFEGLKFEAVLSQLKQRRLENGRYFEGLIESYFINNSHRAVVVLRPDTKKLAREQMAEEQLLAERWSAMDEIQRQVVTENEQRVLAYQEEQDSQADIAEIPRLRLTDLESVAEEIPTIISSLGSATLLSHDIFTNGIVYLETIFDLEQLPGRLLPYAPIYARAIKELGTTEEDYVAFNRRISSRVGGFGAGNTIMHRYRSSQGVARFLLYGKGLARQVPELLNIMKTAALGTNLASRDRFRQIVLESKSALERQVVGNGSGYARSRIAAQLDSVSYWQEKLSGLEQLFFLRELVKRIEQDWPAVQRDLEEFQARVFTRDGLIFNLTVNGDIIPSIQDQLGSLFDALPVGAGKVKDWPTQLQRRHEALLAPTEVNFVACGSRMQAQPQDLSGALAVVLHYVNRGFLWDQIRVRGGAYGAGAGLDYDTGVTVFSSYRDRNLLETISVFKGVSKHLSVVKLNADDLERYKIGLISDLDPHRLPDAKGRVALMRYLSGISAADRQRFRDEAFATSQADFVRCSELLAVLEHEGITVALGSPDRLAALGAHYGAEQLSEVRVL